MKNQQRNMRLLDLYHNASKHSNYQVLSGRLQEIFKSESIKVRTRNEPERMSYIKRYVDFSGMKVVDVGGNTGYFTFESLEHGAREVLYYEGNGEHSIFVKEASEVLGCDSRLNVSNSYLKFGNDMPFGSADIMFLLNVLHHVGDDYGDKGISRVAALAEIGATLQRLSKNVSCLVFQLGFNWKGDRTQPLFDGGTKEELIDFVKNASTRSWRIRKIGVPKMVDGIIEYVDLDDENIERNDALGEFLNRPIFIMDALR